MPRGTASGGYSTLPDSPSTSGASQSQQRQQGQPPPVPAAAAAASATTAAGTATSRGNTYGSLPVAEPTEKEDSVDEPAGTAQTSPPEATAGKAKKRDDGRGERDKAAAPAATAAGGADLTGGLPTTEGVYLGSPVTPQQPLQQQHTMPRMPRTVAPHTGATVLQAPGGGDGNGMIDVTLSQPPYNPGGCYNLLG